VDLGLRPMSISMIVRPGRLGLAGWYSGVGQVS
jgi:hypothetical protein